MAVAAGAPEGGVPPSEAASSLAPCPAPPAGEPAGEAASSPALCAAAPAGEPASKAGPTWSPLDLPLDAAYVLGAVGAGLLCCFALFVLLEGTVASFLLVVASTFLGCTIQMRLGPLVGAWIYRMAGL